MNAELSKVERSLEQTSSELEASKFELSEKDESICRLQKLWETEKSKQVSILIANSKESV